MTSALRPLFVIAGVGNGTGTGAAAARRFAKAGYSVALIARGADSLKKLADEITAAGGTAAAFPIASYAPADISAGFTALDSHFATPKHELRAALFNAAHGLWKPFLEITPAEVDEVLATNVAASFAFAREVILRFKKNEIDDAGRRGTLIFTGATASLRGNTTTSAFAAGKFGVRALSQSLAKEFGKENIHVAHAVIDGGILTDRWRERFPDWETNPDVRLSPEGIAESYIYLVNQERSAWTWELDLRPAHEKW